jgi:uncharacterized membrane protein
MFAVLLATLSGLSYGASDFSGAIATKKNHAALVTFAVQVVSLIALAVILLLTSSATVTAVDLLWGALGGIGATIGLTTFYRALADGPMSTAASVTALVGSLVPVSAGLALGEVPNNPTLVGIALAIPSAIIVSVGGLEAHALARTLSPRARSIARERIAATRRLSLIAGLGFGLFFIALAQASPDSGLYPLLGARGASIAVLAIFLTSQRFWNTIARSDFGSIGIAGLLDFAANSFYLLALADGSVTWVAAVVSLYPVCTVLLARVLLKEQLSRVQIAGLVMASSALVFVGLGAA